MNKNELGILILCLFVFIILVITFYVLLHTLITSLILNIKAGADDEQIKKEYENFVTKHRSKKKKAVNFIFSLISTVLITLLIGVIGYLTVTRNTVVGDIPFFKTVESGSMSYKNDKNEYLVENNLDNQISVNDLIVLEKLPEDKDIQKYDIILYKRKDGMLILHRVIDWQENDNGVRLYKLQGDANPIYDPDQVQYTQMLGIYRGKKIPWLGNFVKFIKSPAGFICIILIVFVSIAYPFIDKKLLTFKKERLLEMGYTIDELIANKYTKK